MSEKKTLRFLLLQGLPASGKSTYAKELVKQGGWVRLNKDDIRESMFGGFRKKNEKNVFRLEQVMAEAAIRSGFNVVIDDTNLNPKVLNSWLGDKTNFGLAEKLKVDLNVHHNTELKIDIKQFVVPLQECIRRDAARERSVGERVIRRMFFDYIVPKDGPHEVEGKLHAIICDMDGTLALMDGRSPYAWDKVGTDKPNKPVIDMVKAYAEQSGCAIIVVSGRDSVCCEQTKEWLRKYLPKYSVLFMRPKDDTRPDEEVKLEIYRNNILGNYNIDFVVDDRQKVVDMWRLIGLTVMQVGDGSF